MQTINTSHVHRFGFQAYGLIALLMVGSALTGALAGYYFSPIQIPVAVSAPAGAPALAQPATAPSIPTGYSEANELWQEKRDLRSGQSQFQLAPVEATPQESVTSGAERDELQREVHDLRQMKSVHPTEQSTTVEAPSIQTNSISERYRLLKEQQLENSGK